MLALWSRTFQVARVTPQKYSPCLAAQLASCQCRPSSERIDKYGRTYYHRGAGFGPRCQQRRKDQRPISGSCSFAEMTQVQAGLAEEANGIRYPCTGLHVVASDGNGLLHICTLVSTGLGGVYFGWPGRRWGMHAIRLYQPRGCLICADSHANLLKRGLTRNASFIVQTLRRPLFHESS